MRYTFRSPSFGNVSEDTLIKNIYDFIKKDPTKEYNIAIATDSQNKGKYTNFVSVITIHKVGSGGILFYHRDTETKTVNLYARMMKETEKTIEMAQWFIERIEKDFLEEIFSIYDHNVHLEIHCDFNSENKSGVAIKESFGWIHGVLNNEDIVVKFKPDAVAASCLADHFVR